MAGESGETVEPVRRSDDARECPSKRGRRYVEVAVTIKQNKKDEIDVAGTGTLDAPSAGIPRRTKGKVSLAPAHTKRKSNGSWKAVTPAPA